MDYYWWIMYYCDLFIDICTPAEVVFFRSAAFSQLPGCFLFIGNIYAGSKALSLLVSAKIWISVSSLYLDWTCNICVHLCWNMLVFAFFLAHSFFLCVTKCLRSPCFSSQNSNSQRGESDFSCWSVGMN